MERNQFDQLMKRVFVLWPRVEKYLDTNCSDPKATLQGWYERVADLDYGLASAVVTKMNSGRLASLGAYNSDTEDVCNIVARHCREALSRHAREQENQALVDAAKRTRGVAAKTMSSQEYRKVLAWYNELYDFYEVPKDGRNRMMLARDMDLDHKIKQEVKNRIEEHFAKASQDRVGTEPESAFA